MLRALRLVGVELRDQFLPMLDEILFLLQILNVLPKPLFTRSLNASTRRWSSGIASNNFFTSAASEALFPSFC